MKKSFLLIPVVAILLFGMVQAKSTETYFKFQLDSPEILAKLTRVISIDRVDGLTVYAYANQEELAEFAQYGYAYEILPAPSSLIIPKMSADKAEVLEWDSYPTYETYVSMMNDFADDYPALCQLYNIGSTVDGRALLFVKISDNVANQEDEPEVLYTATIHGDEVTGYISTLRLADSLLSSYGLDSLITRLVDSCEIWICPLANPDGTYAGGNSSVSGATRYNSNGYDLNRNFPDPEDGPYPGGTRQVETQLMMNFAEAHSFVIGGNFHGGAEVVNYPWDTWSRLHVDNSWWVSVSRMFADSAQYYGPSGYMTDQNDGITNGYAWYTISGGRQDYMNYWQGCREATLEVSGTKMPSAGTLPTYWNALRVSMLDYLEQALYGIRGVVTDANTSLPVLALVRVIGHDAVIDSSMVYTDPDVGDYHRMLAPGTYSVEYSAPGYYSDTVSSLTVSNNQTVRVDLALTPLPNEPALDFAGHNGGLIDPGDNVSMNITLINNGAGISYNTSGLLSSADSYITVTQNSSAFPNISALGGTAQSSTQYQFAVSSACPSNYTAQFRMDVSADGGYADSIFFSIMIGQQIENFESGSFAMFPWEMGGDLPWTIVTANVYEGLYSAKSGGITHTQESSMELTAQVLSAGMIGFHYKVSSESGYDYLRFYIDDVEKQKWSGTVDWTYAEFPVTTGNHTFKWEYTKDGSQSPGSDCGWIDMIVFPPLLIAPEIITAELPDWTVGRAYSQQLQASGGMGALTWSDKNGDLAETGLSLNAGGLLSGTPLAAETVSFTALVTDATSNTDEKVFSFLINAAPQIITGSLPDWTLGRPYSQQLAGSGGTGNLQWSDKYADLTGTGLALSSGGLLSGTPAMSGTINMTVRIIDEAGASAEKEFQFFINPNLQISVDTLPDGIIGQPYSFQLTCSGGTGTKTWTDKYNSLAGSGLSLSTEGLLSGIPVQPGYDGFWAQVQDVTGSQVYKQLGYMIDADYQCGDANSDLAVNVSDAVYIINYVFVGGTAPNPLAAGDANCDGSVNVSDAVWIINYVFVSGNQPCDLNDDAVPDC